MKSWGTYISKHLASFAAFILLLIFVNAVIFGVTFYQTMTEDYGDTSPRTILDMVANSATTKELPGETAQKLQRHNIWAFYLNAEGQCFWAFELPKEVPQSYTIQDVALFSKGYIADYPVFVRNTDDGLLVLGYPKDSYTKLTSNYYSLKSIQQLPLFITGMLLLDIGCLFLAYFFSKRKIIKSTLPIVSAVSTLAEGKPVSLRVSGELSEIANGINKAANILSKQNEARANWISGVSHDIRTPLSMIMGYADQIAGNETVSEVVRKQAEIVRKQSIKIKELVQDLNLVSQLEYDMQPLNIEAARPAKLLRSYVAELLNSGLSDTYLISIEIVPDAENLTLNCDPRLISRAINNLVQNSIKHNPSGCVIQLRLEKQGDCLALSVTDNGSGLSAEKLKELQTKPHYMESTDERLDLRHGLGLLIVQQIVAAHNGTVKIANVMPHGCKITMLFSNKINTI